MSAYHFKYFQNIQFKNHGIAPTPPDLPTLKAYPTPSVGGRFGIFWLKWRERMNLKVPGAILPHGCAILRTRAKTVRGLVQPPLRRTRVNDKLFPVLFYERNKGEGVHSNPIKFLWNKCIFVSCVYRTEYCLVLKQCGHHFVLKFYFRSFSH